MEIRTLHKNELRFTVNPVNVKDDHGKPKTYRGKSVFWSCTHEVRVKGGVRHIPHPAAFQFVYVNN